MDFPSSKQKQFFVANFMYRYKCKTTVCISSGSCISTAKPKYFDLLQETITDLNNLIQNGLDVGEKHYKVLLMCCKCDVPTKATVKNIKRA